MKPVSYFGGEESFKELQKRDKHKRRLCDENNCELIYVYAEYDIQDIEEEIKTILNYS